MAVRIVAYLIMQIMLVFHTTLFSEKYYSNSNKNLFIFPRNAAMANAGLVYTRDAAPLSNPANLPLDSSVVSSLSYSGYYQNVLSTSIGSFVRPINSNCGVGVSVAYLYVPDIEITDQLLVNPKTGDPLFVQDRIAYKASSEVYFTTALGYTIYKSDFLRVACGGAMHILRRKLIESKGYGIGADLGGTLEFTTIGARVSVLADDATTNYIYWNKKYKDKGRPHIRMGIGYTMDVPYLYGIFAFMYTTPDLLSNEGVYYNWFFDEDAPGTRTVKNEPSLLVSAARYGVEYGMYKSFFLRGGVDETRRISFGAGVKLFSQMLAFDFAYLHTYELPGTYALSTSFQWR